jgi:hypothetical protein
LFNAIVPARKPESRRTRVLCNRRLEPRAEFASVEGWIDVDEPGASVRQRPENVECLAVHDRRLRLLGAESRRGHVE